MSKSKSWRRRRKGRGLICGDLKLISSLKIISNPHSLFLLNKNLSSQILNKMSKSKFLNQIPPIHHQPPKRPQRPQTLKKERRLMKNDSQKLFQTQLHPKAQSSQKLHLQKLSKSQSHKMSSRPLNPWNRPNFQKQWNRRTKHPKTPRRSNKGKSATTLVPSSG